MVIYPGFNVDVCFWDTGPPAMHSAFSRLKHGSKKQMVYLGCTVFKALRAGPPASLESSCSYGERGGGQVTTD
jgi:hypothetical protein